jgi:hypothetical protein
VPGAQSGLVARMSRFHLNSVIETTLKMRTNVWQKNADCSMWSGSVGVKREEVREV